MNAQKAPDPSQTRTAHSQPTATPARKPWKKKTPVDVVLDQIDKLREGVAQKEAEFKQAKRQLEKLEEVRKVLEAT